MTAMLTTLLLASTLQAQAARVTITPNGGEVSVGASLRLEATALDADGNVMRDLTIRWVSADPDVVTVSAEGVVTGVRAGQTQITAFVPGAPGIVTIRVPQLPASEITASMPVRELHPGTSAPLQAEARNRLGEVLGGSVISYTSQDTRVATVDATGRVFAHQPGRTTVTVTADGVSSNVAVSVRAAPDPSITITPTTPSGRTGDVIRFAATMTSGNGETALYPAWSVDGAGAQIEREGAEGVFVAERPGTYRVTAVIGDQMARSTVVEIVQRNVPAELTLVGRGATATHHAGDTWAFEGVDGRDYAYLGTFMHDWMKVFDVTDPANPVITDSIQLDARRINDVKIHPNNRIGIVTREGASNRRNGMVILDLSTPAHPTILSEYTETLTGGVHNVWMTSSDLVYAVHNGTRDIHIIDISDPSNPREVGRWGLDKENKGLHDVIVQEGYAFLSYWDDGVVILDVGAGTHGGSPTEPTFVSQYKYPIGNTHVAWRSGRYLFLGDEVFPPNWNADAPIEARGYIHVVDVGDIDNPHEVARYEVPEAGAHNVWVEGDRLYVGYYQAGLRVVDISGELRGDLYRQGRELAVIKTTDAETTVPNWPMTWGAQIFKGNIFTSDLNSGLWILKLTEEIVIP